MRIFFIGTVEFSRIMLNCLLGHKEAKIVGIATKSKSNFNADHRDLSDIAVEYGIPFRYVNDVNQKENIDWIRSLNSDVIYCMGWSSLIKKSLLELSPKGVVGFHPSKLPQNRGRHPLIWALVLGLSESATTFFIMDEGADSGGILSQEIFTIEKEDTASSLYQKMVDNSTRQINEITNKLAKSKCLPIKQDNERANYWRKRNMLDGRIDFRMSTRSIHNLVRALTSPYVGAHFDYNKVQYKVWEAEYGPEQESNIEPGRVLKVNKRKEILVKTGDGSIWLKNHEFNRTIEKCDYLL